jgi:hypothetical protein
MAAKAPPTLHASRPGAKPMKNKEKGTVPPF